MITVPNPTSNPIQSIHHSDLWRKNMTDKDNLREHFDEDTEDQYVVPINQHTTKNKYQR